MEKKDNLKTKGLTGRWKMELDIQNIIHEGDQRLSGIRLM